MLNSSLQHMDGPVVIFLGVFLFEAVVQVFQWHLPGAVLVQLVGDFCFVAPIVEVFARIVDDAVGDALVVEKAVGL